MNVSASKLLLCVSLAGYTFMSWDHLFTPEKPAVASNANKGKDLTAGMVDRSIPLALGGDPFESVKFDRGVASSKKKHEMQVGVLDDGIDKPLPNLALQGILITPTGPVALVNGRPIEEGEIVKLEANKARIRARRIGEDFAVIEGAAQLVTLKLESQKNNPAAQQDAAASEAAAAKERRAVKYQSKITSARD
jgi:hypothetical protein